MSTSTILTPAAAAVAVKNRLSRDLDELRRAAAGAGTLPADEAVSLDLTLNLSSATKALQAAIGDVERYIANAQRAERVTRQRAIADEFNAVVFGV